MIEKMIEFSETHKKVNEIINQTNKHEKILLDKEQYKFGFCNAENVCGVISKKNAEIERLTAEVSQLKLENERLKSDKDNEHNMAEMFRQEASKAVSALGDEHLKRHKAIELMDRLLNKRFMISAAFIDGIIEEWKKERGE